MNIVQAAASFQELVILVHQFHDCLILKFEGLPRLSNCNIKLNNGHFLHLIKLPSSDVGYLGCGV